jgi:hypothetical protein
MEKMNKPYRECYLLSDPSHVYDLTGWDAQNRVYELRNDAGQVVKVKYWEFCPISSAHEDLIEAGDDGKLYTVQQLVESTGTLKWKRPAWADEGLSEATGATASATRPEVATTPRKPKESQAKGHGEAAAGSEAKERVRELLAGASDRNQMAIVAGAILGEDPHELMMKYNHLDNGRYRMTLGNRMVGVLKKQGPTS